MTKKTNGLIIVFTGNGKGKTTAAIGTAFRAIGNDMKVLMIQFIKNFRGYGELNATKLIKNFEIIQMGGGYVFPRRDRKKHIEKATAAWELAKEKILAKAYDIVILDEINYVIDYGLLAAKDVIKFLKRKPKKVHIILTGRNAKRDIIRIADLVTDMREIKHPFRKGIKAQKGIEF